jgi:replication-associated recombination protein RarA
MRARRFSELVGHDKALATIKNMAKEGRLPHTILLTGSPGSGKTTIAQIIAVSLQCKHQKEFGEPCDACWESFSRFDILRINAATDNGVDMVRSMVETTAFSPLMSPCKVVIMNESHSLTTAAKEAFLDETEEPLEHLYWIFTTSNPGKLGVAFKRRATLIQLPNLTKSELAAVMEEAVSTAKVKIKPDTIYEIAAKLVEYDMATAGLALAALERALAGLTPEEAVLQSEATQIDGLAVARAIGKGDWGAAQKLLAEVTRDDIFPLRAIVTGYLKAIVLKDGGENALRASRAIMAIATVSTYEDNVFANATIAAFCGAAKHMRG